MLDRTKYKQIWKDFCKYSESDKFSTFNDGITDWYLDLLGSEIYFFLESFIFFLQNRNILD